MPQVQGFLCVDVLKSVRALIPSPNDSYHTGQSWKSRRQDRPQTRAAGVCRYDGGGFALILMGVSRGSVMRIAGHVGCNTEVYQGTWLESDQAEAPPSN